MGIVASISAGLLFCALFGALCGHFLTDLSSERHGSDRLFAFAGFMCLAAAPLPALLCLPLWPRFAAGLLFLFVLVCGALTFLVWSFYRSSGRKFQLEDVATVMQTDPAEALDFFKSFVISRCIATHRVNEEGSGISWDIRGYSGTGKLGGTKDFS